MFKQSPNRKLLYNTTNICLPPVVAGSRDPERWIKVAVTEGLTVRQLKSSIMAEDKTKVKQYRGSSKKCATCNNSLLKKSRFKIYQDDKLIGDFCSYGCLAAYASNAAVKKQDSGELMSDVQ